MMKTSTTSGVSLLEVIIAMQCTALLLVLVCRVLPLARRQVKEADLRLGSALLAQSVMEEYLTVPIPEWPRDPVSVSGEQRRVLVEALPWNGDSRLRLARVTVLLGEEERYRLETLVMP
jgi:type II secretory pathway pseudopilin PulG